MPLNAEVIIPGDQTETLLFATEHFITLCKEAIADHEAFYVALSGGSTPKALYELLTAPPHAEEIEWDKVHLFWSDERAVAPTHTDSNYHMAMKAGFAKMLLLPQHIHRMVAEEKIIENAEAYEKTIRKHLEDRVFDLVMLGVGEDGHTASLFPDTAALKITGRWVAPNFVPQKNTWRMTLTFDCLNDAANTVFYVMGESKQKIVETIFSTPPSLPCQFIGTPGAPALWILDESAARFLPLS